jgi:hypothetical protein
VKDRFQVRKIKRIRVEIARIESHGPVGDEFRLDGGSEAVFSVPKEPGRQPEKGDIL